MIGGKAPRLVVESSLQELTARVGGAVRVRSADQSRLQDALRKENLSTTASNEHTLLVSGTTSERVGEVAGREVIGPPILDTI